MQNVVVGADAAPAAGVEVDLGKQNFLIQTARRTSYWPTATVDDQALSFERLTAFDTDPIGTGDDKIVGMRASHHQGIGHCGTVRGLARHRHPVCRHAKNVGVLQSRSGLIAMVQGPDNRTYIVHPGDKLLDGAIKSITPQGLVIEQAVNDPLSVVKQREVRKLLRGIEDAK